MAQAENASFGTWLHHSYKCKFSSLTSFLFSFLLPTTLLLLAHSCHGSKDDHFYLDLPSREAFACPEVSSFVNEFDPFYRWSIRSSLPSVLSTTAEIDIELANYVYQQASAWRVISNWPGDGDGTKKLYASAEPHIAGGHMNHNWLWWKMRVDWGISARMCIFIGVLNSNRSCLWTTPIISMENEPDLSQLLVSLPYRVPTARNITPDLDNMKRSTTGYYLTNYASNARTDFTKYQKLDTTSHYYLTSTKQLKKCGFAPSYYNNDAMAYLAFSALQCGCSNSSTKVCVVVTKNMDTSNWGSFDYRSSCDSFKSYWAWNTGGAYWLVLVAHNTSSNKAVPFVATFQGRNTASLTSVTVDQLQAMENTTACVEALMQQSPVPSEVEVVDRCSNNQLELTTKDADYYLNLMRHYIWAPTPPKNNISSNCLDDLRPGQLEFEDKLCVTNLDPASISIEIKQTIESMLELNDVKFKKKKLWEDGSNSRQQAYTAILSALVSFAGTCFLAASRNLQDIENWFENSSWKDIKACFYCVQQEPEQEHEHEQEKQQVKKMKRQDIVKFWFKFVYRAALVFFFGGLLIYTAYISLQSVKKDRDMLQVQTVPQVLSDGTVVLLTTTATYEVTVSWTIVWVVSAITGVITLCTLLVAWTKLKPKSKSCRYICTCGWWPSSGDIEASKEGQNDNLTN